MSDEQKMLQKYLNYATNGTKNNVTSVLNNLKIASYSTDIPKELKPILDNFKDLNQDEIDEVVKTF